MRDLRPGTLPDGTLASVLDGEVSTTSQLRKLVVVALTLDATRFHDLRHTYASRVLAPDSRPYEVSRWLSHASVATTDSIYAHPYPRDDASRVDRLEAILAEGH